MKNLFGCFGLLLIFPIFVIGMILFNSWYLQVIYNIGLTPIVGQFGTVLPQLGFWIFVLIDITLGAIKYFFTSTNAEKSETEKKTYHFWDKEEMSEGVSKAFSPLISNIITKLMQLGLLAIAFNICF